MASQLIIGIVSSVIGGLIIMAIRPSGVRIRYLDGDFFMWCAIAVISVVMGILIGLVFFNTVAKAVCMIVKSAELGLLLAVVLSGAMGVVGTVGIYRGLVKQTNL